jgi:hypothetical protein
MQQQRTQPQTMSAPPVASPAGNSNPRTILETPHNVMTPNLLKHLLCASADHTTPHHISPSPNNHDHLAGSSLPPGWVSMVDPNSGHTYYVDQSTGQSQWTPPPVPSNAPNPVNAYRR